MFGFTRAVGKGSRAQVEGFILPMMSSVYCCETSGKQGRSWEIPDCGSRVRIGRVERQPDRKLMVSTLELKKAMKLLHCSSVVSMCWAVCGLRRWLMVENSCLEFPGFSFMMLE